MRLLDFTDCVVFVCLLFVCIGVFGFVVWVIACLCLVWCIVVHVVLVLFPIGGLLVVVWFALLVLGFGLCCMGLLLGLVCLHELLICWWLGFG